MARSKNELINAFNVKGHLELLNCFLGLKPEDLFYEEYLIDGKKFNVYIRNNELIVQSEDGRSLSICVNHVNRIDNNSYNPVTAASFCYLYEGNRLDFTSLLHSTVVPGSGCQISYDELLSSSMFSIEHMGEPKGLIVKKYENGQIIEGVVSSIEVFDNDPKLIFFGNGTIMYNGVRLTEDGKTITEYRGNKLPSKEEVFSFDVEIEKYKLYRCLRFLGDRLHPITRDIASKSIKNFDSKAKNYLEAKSIYEEYTGDVQRALINCDRFTSGISSQLFTNDELVAIRDAISQKDVLKDNPVLAKKRNNQ